MSEFDLIARIKARAIVTNASRDDVVLGIGDDAALLAPPAGHWLVSSTDTLNDGVHFPPDTAPEDLGWKALAVNLSDLAAMGARPAWCTLSLSLRDADGAWVDGFLDGFFALAALHGVALVGGDTTRGPLSVTVSVQGFVEPGRALRRDGARAGDAVWVTGTVGDATAALSQWRAGGACTPALRGRLDRPIPRVACGLALVGVATACIDVSDGLLADVGHVCAASGVGAGLEVDRLPASATLQRLFTGESRRQLQATGGDDYELCFTAHPDHQATIEAIASATGVAMTCVGRITAGSGVDMITADGAAWCAARSGFDHFIAPDGSPG